MTDVIPGRDRDELSPYAVFRRARLPLSTLAAMDCPSTWRAHDEWERRDRRARELREELADRVGELVEDARDDRRADLVSLRRDLFNGRVDRVVRRTEDAGDLLGPDLSARVGRWLEEQRAASQDREEVVRLLGAEQDAARGDFAAIFEHDSMAMSIQLSGDQLYRSLQRFVRAPRDGKPSKLRIHESSFVNFAYRAAMKPSPFGRFTETGAFDPDSPTTATDRTESTVTLNRLLLNWMVGVAQRTPDGMRQGYLLLNSSLRVEEDAVRFVGVDPKGSDSGFGGSEGVVRLKLDPATRLVLATLDGGSCPTATLRDALVEATGQPEASERMIRVLINIGLLFYRPGFDELDPGYDERLGRFLAAAGTPETTAIAESFQRLRHAQDSFGQADAQSRGELIADSLSAIRDIAAVSQVDVPPESTMRSPLFEDTWTAGGPRGWDGDAVSGSLPALGALSRLAGIADQGQVRRLGLYDFARSCFPDATTVPFLDLFARFTELDPDEQRAVLDGVRSSSAQRFAADRTAAFAQLRSSLHVEDGTARLGSDRLREICDRVPRAVQPGSVTFRVQLTNDEPRPQVVVNGVLSGHGVYFSRFASFVERSTDPAWTLRERIRAHLRRTAPGQADLNAVLGFNFNLHPFLTDAMVDYPGAWGGPEPDRRHALSDLDVELDDESGSLHLREAGSGDPVDLVPMNFLIPVGVPALYQVLEALSPTTRYPWNPLDDLLACGPEEPSPRLVVDDVVADRRAWRFPATAVPSLETLSRGEPEDLLGFDVWRRELGLPQQCFVTCQTPQEYAALTGRRVPGADATTDSAHLHRASVHKPMYVDFRNPFLVRSFARTAASREGVLVVVRECLPAVADYRSPHGPAAAEEYFVELNQS
ncbi:lanthionine biosynthesis protein [Marmoricola endophyticus]|uniref:Lanthionine biosynthesis protein n=1 Tax=Marmoricola endophyticus TaxID=2040280 RepID=A0A917F5F7_9ACTN|nr:lantibiotic dehydratase [Marmoricola endophyticus]GGF53947.1 lanthionine biosynthesis protein [Marmoricola endophyticus]